MSWFVLLQTLLAGLLAISGGVAGSLITLKAQRDNASNAAAREDQLRWVRDTRDAGADLIVHCHEFEDASVLLHKSLTPGREPLSDARKNELWRQLVEARSGIARASTLLSMIAPEEVASQAHEVLELASNLGRVSEGTEFDYSEERIGFSDAVAEFIFLMRESLGAEPKA